MLRKEMSTKITSMLIFTSKPFLSLNFDASGAPGGVVQGLRAVRPRRVAPELQGTLRLPARFRRQIHRTECAAGVEGRSRRHNDSRRGARSSRKLCSSNALCYRSRCQYFLNCGIEGTARPPPSTASCSPPPPRPPAPRRRSSPWSPPRSESAKLAKFGKI